METFGPSGWIGTVCAKCEYQDHPRPGFEAESGWTFTIGFYSAAKSQSMILPICK